jgi:glycosyltransferase involved in cell wall biosynthesis
MKKTLDIVTSAFNEEECIDELYKRIDKVMRSHTNYSWRLIICDNGSTDKTWLIINELAARFHNVLGLRMSRTFTFDQALTCGIDHAEADALVIMASDLQDPPEVIKEFIHNYELGFDQVVAKITSRKSVPLVRRLLSRIFYKLANNYTNNLIPQGVSDFRLISKKVYSAARGLREKNRFIRGLIAWTGFNTKIIEIERPPRFGGESKFLSANLSKVIQWASSAILSHTSKPLLTISYLGFFMSIISFMVTIILAIFWFQKGVPFAGFGTLVSLIILSFSFTLLSIGILGQYIALIYEEVKDRPIYIISESTGRLKNFLV